VFSGGVLISVLTKCGKWVVYGERVTFLKMHEGIALPLLRMRARGKNGKMTTLLLQCSM